MIRGTWSYLVASARVGCAHRYKKWLVQQLPKRASKHEQHACKSYAIYTFFRIEMCVWHSSRQRSPWVVCVLYRYACHCSVPWRILDPALVAELGYCSCIIGIRQEGHSDAP